MSDHSFDAVFADLFAPVRAGQLQLVPVQLKRDAAENQRDIPIVPRDAEG